MNSPRAIGPWGTAARVALGAFLLCLAFSDLTVTDYSTPPWHAFVIGLGVMPALLLLVQKVRLRFTPEKLDATGPLATMIGAVIAAVLFSISSTQEAALLFFGLSLLLAAVRGYAGCEVLAISNWLLHRDDQVGCVVLSPLDAMEAEAGRQRTT